MIRMPFSRPEDSTQDFALSPEELSLLQRGGLLRVRAIGSGLSIHLSVIGTTPIPKPDMKGGEQDELPFE